MQTILVKVNPDHLERLAKAKRPILAIAELVWNGLDADAMQVRVELDRNELGGIEAIHVRDDGHGIAYTGAADAFENLGGS